MNLPIVHLNVAHYHNELRLFISFSYSGLTPIVKRLPFVQWSNTHRAWYVTYQPVVLDLVKQLLKGRATIDFIGLSEAPAIPTPTPDHQLVLVEKQYVPADISSFLKRFNDYLASKRYSPSTIKTYSDALRVFFSFLKYKPVEYITNEDLLRFHNEYILARKLSASYQNQAINAVKLFFGKLGNRQFHVEMVTRPRTEKRLPNVLSKEEVKLILDAPINLKHRTMLSVIYACGLRSGELLQLKPEHIDSKRNLLIIKQAKGKKDRIVPLSLKIIDMLREYYKLYRPKIYLFEGSKPGNAYDERSLQSVLKQTLAKTSVKKPVTLHWLRHSYATHLLESGTDIRYIQTILGHQSSKTTDIYTHVSNKSIQNITSPFDNL